MRKKLAIRNVIAYLVYYIIATIIGFASRKIFLYYLGNELLGLGELLTSIISMLSLLELGFGSAISYSLYKPLADNDQREIRAIMQFYKKVYYVVGLAVLIIGLIFVPFLHLFVNTSINIGFIYKIFIIFLADTVLSYYLAYRRSIICADQREYIATIADGVAYLLTVLLQILTLIYTGNYLLFLLVKVFFVILRNLYIYIKAGKLYPAIVENEKTIISKKTKNELYNNIKAIFLGNIGCYLISGTDNLYLSWFANLTAVYIYSNYKMIIDIVNRLFNQPFSYIRATIGNYIVSHNKSEIYVLFKNMFFINYWITSFTSITLLTVINPFISIWLGEEYTWPILIILLIVLKNHASMMNQVLEAFRSAAGIFAPKRIYRYTALIEGFLNIFFSIILAKYMGLGIYGIFGGTVISNMVSVIIVPYMVYRYLFDLSIKEYFKLYFIYLLNTIIFYVIVQIIIWSFRDAGGLTVFVIGVFTSAIVVFGGNILIYMKTSEMAYLKDIVCELRGKISKIRQGE